MSSFDERLEDRDGRTNTATAVAPPAVVLVEPQLAQNIGATARAMANFNVTDLRLVAPKQSHTTAPARAMASCGKNVLDKARTYATLEHAVLDSHFVLATSARPRDMNKQVMSPRLAAAKIDSLVREGRRVCMVFGPERTGLDNDAVALAHGLVHIPSSAAVPSLNLAQAVLLLCYEWSVVHGHDGGKAQAPEAPEALRQSLATEEEMLQFFHHLEAALAAAGFFHPVERHPIMVRNLRSIFTRGGLTSQEVRTLRGVINALLVWPRDQVTDAIKKDLVELARGKPLA